MFFLQIRETSQSIYKVHQFLINLINSSQEQIFFDRSFPRTTAFKRVRKLKLLRVCFLFETCMEINITDKR